MTRIARHLSIMVLLMYCVVQVAVGISWHVSGFPGVFLRILWLLICRLQFRARIDMVGNAGFSI